MSLRQVHDWDTARWRAIWACNVYGSRRLGFPASVGYGARAAETGVPAAGVETRWHGPSFTRRGQHERSKFDSGILSAADSCARRYRIRSCAHFSWCHHRSAAAVARRRLRDLAEAPGELGTWTSFIKTGAQVGSQVKDGEDGVFSNGLTA